MTTATATEEGYLDVPSDDESTASSSFKTAYTRVSPPRNSDASKAMNTAPPTVIRVPDRSPSTVYEDFDDDSGSSDIDDDAVQRLQLPSLAELLDGKARASGTYTIAPSRPIINEDAYENDSNSSDIDDDAVAAFDLPSLDVMAGRMAGVGAGMNMIGSGGAASNPHPHPRPSSYGTSEARHTPGPPEPPDEPIQKQHSPDSLYTSTPSPGPSYYQRRPSSSQAPPTPAYSVATFDSRTTDESALDVGDLYQSRYHYTPFDSISSRGTRPSSYRGSIDQVWYRANTRGSVDSRASGGQYAAYRSRGSVDSRASSLVDEFGALTSRGAPDALAPHDVPAPPAHNELGLRLAEVEEERAARQPSTSTFGTGSSSHLQPRPSQSSVSSSTSSSDTPYATPKTSFTNARASVNSRGGNASVNSRGVPPVPPMPAALARRISTASSASSASNIFISPDPRGPRPRLSFVSNADTHTTDESALDVGDEYVSWADRLADQMPYAHFVGHAPGGGRYAAFGAFAALEMEGDEGTPPSDVPSSTVPSVRAPSEPSLHAPSDPSIRAPSEPSSSSTATLPSTAKAADASRPPSDRPQPPNDRYPYMRERLASSDQEPSSSEHIPSSMEQIRSTSDVTTISSSSESYAAPQEGSRRYPTTVLDPYGREREIYPRPDAFHEPELHGRARDVYGRDAEMYRAPSTQTKLPDRVIPPAVPAKDMPGQPNAPFPPGHPAVAWERQQPDGHWERLKPNGDFEPVSPFYDEAYEEARRHSASLIHPGGTPELVAYSPEDWAQLRSAFPEYEARMRQLQERGYDASDPEDDGPEVPYGYPGMPHPYPYGVPYDPAYGPPPMDDERGYLEGWYGNRTLSIIEEESAEHMSSVGMPGHSDIDPHEQRSQADTDEIFRRQAMRSTMTVATSDARISFTESMPSSLCALKSIPSRSTLEQTPRTIPSSDSLFSDAQSMSRGGPNSNSSSSDLPPSTPRLTVPSSMPSTSSLETPETTPLTDRSPRTREKELVRERSGSAELGFGHLFVARPQTLFSGRSSTQGSGPSEGDWRDSKVIDRWLPDELGLQAPARAISPTPVVQKPMPSKPQRPALQSTPSKMQPSPSKASSVQSTPSRAAAQRDYYKTKYGEELQTLVSSDDESDIVLHPRRQVPPPPPPQKPSLSAQKGKQPQITPQSSSGTDTGYEPLTDSGLSLDDGRSKRPGKDSAAKPPSRSQATPALDMKERGHSSSRTTPSKPVIPVTSRTAQGYAQYSHAQESSSGSRVEGVTDIESEYSSQSYSKLPPRPVAPIPSTSTSEAGSSAGRPKTPSHLRPKTPASSSRSKTPVLVETPSRSKTPIGKSRSSKTSKAESEIEWYSYSMDQSSSSISAHRTESPAPQSERSHGRSDKSQSRSDKSQSRSDKSSSRTEKTQLRPRVDRPDSRASRTQDQTGKTKSRLLDDGTEITTSYQRITQDMLDRFMPHASSSSDGHQSTSTPTPSRSMEDSSRSRDKGKGPSVAAPTPRRAEASSTSSRSSTPANRAKTPSSTTRSSTPSARSSTPKAQRPSSSASRTPQPTSTSARTSQASSSSRPSQQSSSSSRRKERPVPVPSVPPVPGLPLAVQAVANAHAARTGSRIAQVPPNSQAPVIPRGVHIPRSASSAGYAASSSSISEY
ncbi:hypothetical protein HDZ31DRAFT_66476 [Schizophyllum fasciatum]